MSRDPSAVVRRQFDAYNAHDIDAYMDCFAPDIEMYVLGETAPFLKGHAAVRDFYATKRFNIPALRAVLHDEIAHADTVVYRESLVDLVPGETQTAVAIHTVKGGKIHRMWFAR